MIATILMSSVPLSVCACLYAFVSASVSVSMLHMQSPEQGVLVVSNFAGEIFSNIFPAHRNLATVMLPIAAGFGVVTVSIGADRFGRKPMLLFSCGGMSLAMVTMTGYYWCFASKEWVLLGKETWEWASFVAMTLYAFRPFEVIVAVSGQSYLHSTPQSGSKMWRQIGAQSRFPVTPQHAQCQGCGGEVELSVAVACCSAARVRLTLQCSLLH